MGAVSLNILEEVVDDWIDSQKSSLGVITYMSMSLISLCLALHLLVT